VSTPDEAARSGALLAPSAELGTLSVTGPDRSTWLHGVVTCDVEDLAPGDGRWGLLLTRQGKILADVSIVAEEHALRLGIVRSALARAHDYLASFLIMEDAELTDDSASFAWVTLHGPTALEVARAAGRQGGAAARLDVTGLGGAAVVIAREKEPAVREAALAAGAIAATEEDLARLRVERLVPAYGVDMDEQRSPHEVSLERRTVSWSKGCYLGQEAVCMQDMRGKVKRRLAIVRLEGASVPASGAKVFDAAGAVVGETRSAALSSLLGGPAALAFLSAASAVPGTALTVEEHRAVVVEPR
jgi:hypothetical protein